MKTYTEEEVNELIHGVVLETAKGVRDWFEKETVITDNETGYVLTNATIGLKENRASPLKDYIYPRLEKLGVEYNTELGDIFRKKDWTNTEKNIHILKKDSYGKTICNKWYFLDA